MKNQNEPLSYFNELQCSSLHITTNLGTSIIIGLEENNTTWQQISATEITIQPDKYCITGMAIASQPVGYKGETLTGVEVEFADGRAIAYSCEGDSTTLKDTIEKEEDASFVSKLTIKETSENNQPTYICTLTLGINQPIELTISTADMLIVGTDGDGLDVVMIEPLQDCA